MISPFVCFQKQERTYKPRFQSCSLLCRFHDLTPLKTSIPSEVTAGTTSKWCAREGQGWVNISAFELWQIQHFITYNVCQIMGWFYKGYTINGRWASILCTPWVYKGSTNYFLKTTMVKPRLWNHSTTILCWIHFGSIHWRYHVNPFFWDTKLQDLHGSFTSFFYTSSCHGHRIPWGTTLCVESPRLSDQTGFPKDHKPKSHTRSTFTWSN